MRRQDEIRLLLPGRDPGTQKFLLAELDRFAQAFDADEVLEVLEGHLASPHAEVGRQALATVTHFFAEHAPRRYGLVPTAVGMWTAINAVPERDAKPAADAPAQQLAVRAAAAKLLAPLAQELAARVVALPPERRALACAALALLPEGHLAAAPLLDREASSFSVLWAWAIGGGGAADPERLAELLAGRGVEDPDLLLAARALPFAALAELVAKIEGRVDWRGRAHLALAIAGAGDRGAPALLERFGEPRTDWGDVYVLRAAEQMKGATALSIVKAMHEKSPHEFVRQQAVRAAGGLGSLQAVEFCLAQLGREPALVSQVLESLVRLRCPRDMLAKAAAPYREAADVRARVAALLATTGTGGERLPASFVPLLRHAEPLPRVEAAFCLGYWRGAASLKILAALAAHDPHPQVRQQAIKSLSRFDVKASVPVLTRIVKSGEPAEALTAARVMVRLDDTAFSDLSHFFLTELVKCADPDRRALLLRALGSIAAGATDPGVLRVFSAALNVDASAVLRAALDGLNAMGGPPTPEVVKQVAAVALSADPTVAVAAHVTAFLAGDLQAPERVLEALRSPEPGSVRAALDAALEMVLLATRVIGPQHEALARALGVARAPAAKGAPALEVSAPRAAPLDEGDFEPAGGDAEGGETVEAASLVEGVRAMAESAARRPAEDLRPSLETTTNLVPKIAFVRADVPRARSRAAQRPKLEDGRSWRAIALLAAFALALGLAARAAFRTGPASGGAAAGGQSALTVWQVKGTVRLSDQTRGLEPGESVSVGQTLVLSEGGRASLVTGMGDEVRLAEGAQVKVVGVKGPGSLTLEPLAGAVECAFGPGRTITLAAGRRSVTGTELRLWVKVREDGWLVKPERTMVEAVGADGAAQRLAPGQEHLVR